ncbi:hypothetical protein V7190_10915 [Bacillus velezensis]|uniref:hypothetical protein n=1 Tax=Bacillus velezensis TaxID=492670 RepID=UPI002FFD92DE
MITENKNKLMLTIKNGDFKALRDYFDKTKWRAEQVRQMADEFKWLSKYGYYADNIPIHYSAWKLTSRGFQALKD